MSKVPTHDVLSSSPAISWNVVGKQFCFKYFNELVVDGDPTSTTLSVTLGGRMNKYKIKG